MRNILVGVVLIILYLFTSCKSSLPQDSMFAGRGHKNKKGVYDTGLNKRKPMSVQIAEELDKQTKHDKNPKKAAKKAKKEFEKKQRESKKERDKHNKKVRTKILKKVKKKDKPDTGK
jgi:hypothetical protein